MKIAVLSNFFKEFQHKEVEEELTLMGKVVERSLSQHGHDVKIYDVNEKTFEELRKAKVDFAFNVCERFNGNSFFEPHVASMLDLLNIPYSGSGPLTLALCMNKARVKEILSHNGIPTPKFQVFYSKSKKINPELKYPLIVKPVCMDNSIGINENAICRDEAALRKRIAYILRMFNQPALVEEYIEGREIAIAVMGNKDPVTLPISEFIFDENLYFEKPKILSYDVKWDFVKGCIEKCPADLPKYMELKIKKIALETYKLLELRDYGRVDIRISQDGTPYVLEMNPNPGISADDTIPRSAISLGLTHEEMIYEIFKAALERYPQLKLDEPFSLKERPVINQVVNHEVVGQLNNPPVSD